MTTRNYSSRSQQSTLTSAVTAGATTIVVQSGPALLGGATIAGGTTFTLVIDPDTALEEIVDATAVSTNTFTITRAIDGSSAQAHSAGAVTRHMAIGRDYREANVHIESTTGVHGATGAVVGTTDTQTLTNKTLTAPTITNPSITGAGVDASIVFEGATADAHETTLTVVDPTQDNTITLPNTTGTVVLDTATQTLTNKTLTSPTISGSPVITGLSSAGMSASSATPKDYVDSILGSATSAATSAASAATSATSAATSATSAATSATASASSATASASSATAAATSATSAAASATAAATSATSAAASATAAATSATSAAASATTAAASVATIAGYATTASNSASAAATSAASASASATAAATSATSAAASAASIVGDAAAAATSAASASTSAASALTSATSAAASATTAAASVATIAGYATTASNSASAAATSAASASTSASSASTDAASAATSASSALTSATSAATSYDSFDDRYLGAKAVAPTVDNDGNALLTGALYWNTAVNKMYVWSGTAWGEISSSADIIAYKYTVTGGATSVSGADDNGLTLTYTVGKEQVYINGVLQVRGSDYTATTGSSITGMAAMLADDIVTVLAFTAFVVANTYTQAEADAKFLQNANNVAVGKNQIINGNMVIAQRATSAADITTDNTYYTVDRFLTRYITAGQFTQSQESDAPAGFSKSLKMLCTTAEASLAAGSRIAVQTRLEGSSVQSLEYGTASAKTITLSFWVKSNVTGTYIAELFNDNGLGKQVSRSYTINASGVWEKKTFTILGDTSTVFVDDSIGRFNLLLWLGAGSNWTTGTLQTAWNTVTSANRAVGQTNLAAATNNYWQVTGIQVEIGSIATAFQTATGTIQGELAACQRYYYRQTATSNYSAFGYGTASGASDAVMYVSLPQTMRAQPSAVDYSTLSLTDQIAGFTFTTLSLGNQNGKDIAQISLGGLSGLTQYRSYFIGSNNSSSGYLGLSAEL